MPGRIRWPMVACFILICAALARAQEVRARFTGAFADGTRFQKARLGGWPDAKGQPRVQEARDLGAVFDAKNPVSWLFNELAETPAAPRPCVEFFGGDRLPGQVLGYRYGTEAVAERLPAHLVVKLDPDAVRAPQTQVRVLAQAVRRVIWQPRRTNRYTPSTLYLLDDRAIRFRALRWTAEGVTVLLDEGGTRNLPFAEIAELHLPRRDPWRVYQETLAVLSPDCSARLMRIETSRGLQVTGTMERSQVNEKIHMLQPAWCLDPVGYAHAQLRWWRFFWPHEVPLAIIDPLRDEQRAPLEGGRSWQADQNVKLQPLRSGGQLHGSGFGMHAYTQLEFELPAAVRGFRASVGMDGLAFRGGCGRGRIHINSSADKPLWQSKVLVGDSTVVPTEFLPLQGPAQGQKTLILVAEAPTVDRPDEADPLHIRSFVDWLEPCLDLDLAKLRADVQPLVPLTISAWQGWTVKGGANAFRVSYRWDVRDPTDPRFQPDVIVPGGSLVLSRQVDVGPKQNFLCLALCRPPGPPSGWLEVRVAGQPAGDMDVPSWEMGHGRPWYYPTVSLVPLAKHRGKTVPIEVEFHPAEQGAGVHWRGLELVESRDLVPWTPVDVVEARAAAAETKLVQEPEHMLLATTKDPRKVPATDTYTIVADTKLAPISAFRLELIPEQRIYGGLGRNGLVFLSEFKVKAAPPDQPDKAESLTLTAAGTDYYGENPPAAAVDGQPETGWLPSPRDRVHVLVCTPAQNVSFPGGARLTFTIEQNLFNKTGYAGQSPALFRLSVTDAARPVPLARSGIVLEPPGLKTIFEDDYQFVNQLAVGPGMATIETGDKYSGAACIKLSAARHTTAKFFGEIRIRREPGRGEFRYLQFAWKKSGGQSIGLMLAHDGRFGPDKPTMAAFRYHAGPEKTWAASSVQVSDKLPGDWVLVTRDLFADFGEFNLTGLGLDPLDGAHALYDRIRLGRTRQDLEKE
jgi:hypothetical protein